MDIDPAAPSVISVSLSFSGKVPETPVPISEKLAEKPGNAPPPKQQNQQRPVVTSSSSSGGAFSRAAAILEMSKASKSNKSGAAAQSPAVVAASVQATATADSAEQSARNARNHIRFRRFCHFCNRDLQSLMRNCCYTLYSTECRALSNLSCLESCMNLTSTPAAHGTARRGNHAAFLY